MDNKPDKTEKLIRFACGSLFGFLIGASSLTFFYNDPYPVFLILLPMFLCGLLAMKYGDKFWYSKWWRFWWF